MLTLLGHTFIHIYANYCDVGSLNSFRFTKHFDKWPLRTSKYTKYITYLAFNTQIESAIPKFILLSLFWKIQLLKWTKLGQLNSSLWCPLLGEKYACIFILSHIDIYSFYIDFLINILKVLIKSKIEDKGHGPTLKFDSRYSIDMISSTDNWTDGWTNRNH